MGVHVFLCVPMNLSRHCHWSLNFTSRSRLSYVNARVSLGAAALRGEEVDLRWTSDGRLNLESKMLKSA